jgi:putative Holliday junction resolvase
VKQEEEKRRGGEEETGTGSSPPLLFSSSPLLAPKGRLLGVDYGAVRVGLAISDPDRIIASPFDTLTRSGEVADAAYFTKLVTSEKVVGLVVGLPLHTRGHEGVQSAEARRYGAWLASVTGLPVVFWDERFTSALADDAFREAKLSHKKRKDRRDRVAAVLILQGFLDAGCPAGGTDPVPDQRSD